MNKAKRYTLFTIVFIAITTHAVAVAPFKKVSIATTTSSTSTSTTEAANAEGAEVKHENITSGPTKNPKLTGIPQIDYIWDPNLPRELRGYNLSNYPFFATTPPEEDIHFKCDGLHDGFYASIEHKCQVYHHCVYGIRHDFLCANFTAFDQKTFICHFASDVDCEGSQKYWNRNDDLYMATTTTSTTTTTTEPPPTPRRRLNRPHRPLRRPFNRRPIDDYYYDEEEYADDDYYEERVNQRRKQRPRHRKPQLEYDDEYDEKRSLSEEEKPRRQNSRDRFQDTDLDPMDDYGTERRKLDRSKARNKANVPAERRKIATRRPIAGAGRTGTDERRSFADERPVNGRKDKLRPTLDDAPDSVDAIPRRGVTIPRRRPNERRPLPTASTAADIDDLDYYEKPHAQSQDEEAAAEDDALPKVRTTPKPLEEFITPKAASSSVFARPRAPPRIARPVPVNEKKKFEYSIQKTTATTPASVASNSDAEDYEEYDEYDEALTRPRAPASRRRVVDDGLSKSDSDDFPPARRRTHNDAPLVGRKPTRTTIRKPVTDKKAVLPADEEYDSTGFAQHNDRFEGRPLAGRKRPHGGRTRVPSRATTDDVDFVDEEYDDQPVRPAHRLRPKTLARKGAIKPRPPVVHQDEDDLYDAEPEQQQPVRHRPSLYGGRHKSGITAKLRHQTDSEATAEEDKPQLDSETGDDADAALTSNKNQPAAISSGRHSSVRVVKRPFLPSRGGSPYLPRGLQPVGIAHRPLGNGNGNGNGNAQTTDSTSIDMGSTISGVHLLEHGAPILRDSGNEREREREHDREHNHNRNIADVDQLTVVSQTSPRSTLPPRSAIPIASQPRPDPEPEPQLNKATLDELYETDYDVTLNDALNPTLKPLSPHPNHHHTNRNYASAYASSSPGAANPFVSNNQSPAIYHSISNSNNNNKNNHNNHNNNDDNDNYQHQNQHQHHQIAYQTLPSSHHSQPQTLSHNQQSQHQPHQQHQHQQQSPNNYNSDSYFSSTDIRRRAIVVPAPASHPSRPSTQYRGVGARIAQHFYDDFDY